MININEYYFNETIIKKFNIDKELYIEKPILNIICNITYKNNIYNNILITQPAETMLEINKFNIDDGNFQINGGLLLDGDKSEITIVGVKFVITENNELMYNMNEDR